MKIQTVPLRATLNETVTKLETIVSRFERRYECTSAEMLEMLQRGQARDTAEVSKWISTYKTLQRLRPTNGHTTGSPTSNT